MAMVLNPAVFAHMALNLPTNVVVFPCVFAHAAGTHAANASCSPGALQKHSRTAAICAGDDLAFAGVWSIQRPAGAGATEHVSFVPKERQIDLRDASQLELLRMGSMQLVPHGARMTFGLGAAPVAGAAWAATMATTARMMAEYFIGNAVGLKE